MPESPVRIEWIRDFVCIAYRNEYSLLNDSTGRTSRLALASKRSPTSRSLPMEEVSIVSGMNLLIFDSSGKEILKTPLHYQPASLGFSFPYLFSLSKDGFVEIKNIVDPLYHEVLRSPSTNHKLHLLKDDYKGVYVAESTRVYKLKSSYIHDFDKENIVIRSIHKKSDTVLFVLYIREVLNTEGTAFNLYLKSYVTLFKEKLKEVVNKITLDELKSTVTSYIRKFYKVLTIMLSKVITKPLKEQLYLAISIAFHNQIYDELEGFMLSKLKQENKNYHEDLDKVKSCSPTQFGVRKKFLLTPESAEDSVEVPTKLKVKKTNSDDGDQSSFQFSHILENISLSSHLDSSDRDIEGLHLSGFAQYHRCEDDNEEYEYVDTVRIYYDDDYRLFIYFDDGSSNEILFGERFIFDENNKSMYWKLKEQKFKIVFEDEDEFKEFMTQFRFSSSTDALSESMFTKPEIMSEYEEFSSQLKSTLTPLLTKTFSGPRRVLSVRSNSFKRTLRTRPSTNDMEFKEVSYEEFQNDNYRPAYAILRSLPKRKSPREKVECILRVLNKTIECIETFWTKYNKSIIVGADDLVPIFTYIVAKGAVPNMHSEMNYIIEFSNESCIRGKYGYALATLQMAVDNLTVVDNSSRHESIGEKGARQVKQLMNVVDTFTSKVNRDGNTGLEEDQPCDMETKKEDQDTNDREELFLPCEDIEPQTTNNLDIAKEKDLSHDAEMLESIIDSFEDLSMSFSKSTNSMEQRCPEHFNSIEDDKTEQVPSCANEVGNKDNLSREDSFETKGQENELLTHNLQDNQSSLDTQSIDTLSFNQKLDDVMDILKSSDISDNL